MEEGSVTGISFLRGEAPSWGQMMTLGRTTPFITCKAVNRMVCQVAVGQPHYHIEESPNHEARRVHAGRRPDFRRGGNLSGSAARSAASFAGQKPHQRGI